MSLLMTISVERLFFFFFFSSRRRHTRCSRDWSSDVCSSDLRSFAASWSAGIAIPWGPSRAVLASATEIGRASCRESVDLGGRRIIKKKNKKNDEEREQTAEEQSEEERLQVDPRREE